MKSLCLVHTSVLYPDPSSLLHRPTPKWQRSDGDGSGYESMHTRSQIEIEILYVVHVCVYLWICIMFMGMRLCM